jgi:hypothetical protein
MFLTKANTFAKNYAKRNGLKKVRNLPIVLSKAGIILHVEAFYGDVSFIDGIAVVLSVPHKKDYSVVRVEGGKVGKRLAL